MRIKSFLVAALLLPTLAFSETSDSRITILKDFVSAIGAAGDAISKLTVGFKDLVVAGKDSYNYVAAERERSRLIDISRRTANLIASQNVRVVESFDQYLLVIEPTNADWAHVAQNVEATLVAVHELLRDVRNENGDFVLEPAFLALNQTLSARSSLLHQLIAIPAPTSPDERRLLREASDRYKILIVNARQAVEGLNAYVKAKK
jgi:hypothetical protein